MAFCFNELMIDPVVLCEDCREAIASQYIFGWALIPVGPPRKLKYGFTIGTCN